MLLQRLVELTERPAFDHTPTLYARVPVRYIVELKSDGSLATPHLTDTADPSDRAMRRGQPRLMPQVQRSSGVKPLLLCDKADYLLGWAAEGKAERAQACHEAFLDLIARCAEATEEPSVVAVQRFLASDPLGQLQMAESFDPSAMITFRVGTEFPSSLTSVQRFWAEANDPETRGGPQMQCLVCGSERPVLDRLQLKIKGVPGGQTSGTSIISANAEAFESYGLSASLIAPTCADCGERFTKAANHLLSHEESRVVIGGAAFVFWTREDVPFDLFRFIREPSIADVRQLLEALRTGRRTDIDDSPFYATALSGSGGRTVVRDWMDTTVGAVRASLARWFSAQEIVGRGGEPPTFYGLFPLAAATVRDARDLAPPTSRSLLHAALSGGPVPRSLLQQALARNQAEQRVTQPRAALIKLALSTNGVLLEGAMIQLNQDHPSAAYQCGRLLAVLESTQRAAIPGINATIVDRFFGSAASSPRTVMSRLVLGSRPHLAKLRRDRPPAYIALETRIEEILGHLGAFPSVLDLEGQGLFALGFYHQRASDRAGARDAAQRRRLGQAVSEEEAAVAEIEEAAIANEEK